MGKKILFLFIFFISIQMVFSKPLIFVRGDDNYPPYEMMENGRLVGIHVELIEEISKILNVEVKIMSVPWKRAIEMMKTNVADGILYVTKSESRKKYIDFHDGNIMSDTNIVLFCLKENYNIFLKNGEINSKDLTVGVVRGFYYGENFEKMKFKTSVAVSRLDQLIKLLKHKRVDLFIASETDITYKYLDNPEKISDIDILKPYIRVTKNYLGFSKNQKVISKKFAMVMRSFRQTKKYKEILKKYRFYDK